MGDSSDVATDPEPDSLCESQSEQDSECDSESESESESSSEGIYSSFSSVRAEDFCRDSLLLQNYKSHCLVTNELRKKDSDKDRSLPSLRGPTRLRKLRHVSESPKRHWISAPESFSLAFFDRKTKTNCEGETLYRAPVSVTPSGSRMRKISSSRIFFWVSS